MYAHEDIIDTGLTLKFLKKLLERNQQLQICVFR
jgi:hypoxanthine-guanine phosphoribosyltransferase